MQNSESKNCRLFLMVTGKTPKRALTRIMYGKISIGKAFKYLCYRSTAVALKDENGVVRFYKFGVKGDIYSDNKPNAFRTYNGSVIEIERDKDALLSCSIRLTKSEYNMAVSKIREMSEENLNYNLLGAGNNYNCAKFANRVCQSVDKSSHTKTWFMHSPQALAAYLELKKFKRLIKLRTLTMMRQVSHSFSR